MSEPLELSNLKSNIAPWKHSSTVHHKINPSTTQDRRSYHLDKQPHQHSLLHCVLYKARTVETMTTEGVKKLPTKRKKEHKIIKIARAFALNNRTD